MDTSMDGVPVEQAREPLWHEVPLIPPSLFRKVSTGLPQAKNARLRGGAYDYMAQRQALVWYELL
jgi:hypothetical protein